LEPGVAPIAVVGVAGVVVEDALCLLSAAVVGVVVPVASGEFVSGEEELEEELLEGVFGPHPITSMPDSKSIRMIILPMRHLLDVAGSCAIPAHGLITQVLSSLDIVPPCFFDVTLR